MRLLLILQTQEADKYEQCVDKVQRSHLSDTSLRDRVLHVARLVLTNCAISVAVSFTSSL